MVYNKISQYRSIGFLLLMSLALTLVMSVIEFFVYIEINPYTFPLSILITIGSFLFYSNGDNWYKVKVIICFSLILIFSLIASSLIYDYSYDGQAYHQVSIYHLMKGWNPIYQTCPSESMNIWVNHYAKGLEIVSASIGSTFSNIEIGKAVNFILSFSSYFFVLHFLELYKYEMLRIKKYLYSFIVAFSPVVCSQLFTYYIDWALYVLFVILWVTIYEIIKFSKLYVIELLIISIVIIFSISFKFNFAFWIGLSLLLFLVILFNRKENVIIRRLIPILLSSYLLGFLISYNPYITNLQAGYHFLYPLVGDGKVDIMSAQTPDCFKTVPYFVSVLLSLFSRPSQSHITIWILYSPVVTCCFWLLIIIMIFSFRKLSQQKELQASLITFLSSFLFFALLWYLWSDYFSFLWQVDLRIGGFGFFFPEIIILSIITMIKANNSSNYRAVCLIMLSLIACLFLLPSGWWARYVPFFYLFCLVPILYVEKYGGKVQMIVPILAGLMLVNSLLIIERCINHGVIYTSKEASLVEMCRQNSPIKLKRTVNNGFLFKLNDAGVLYEYSDDVSFATHLFPEVVLQQSVNSK